MLFSSNPRPAKPRHRERGYVLLTLMLAVALLMIAATAAITPLAFRMKRDREEEMIHRGVQYTRAIRAYYKKFGRYPTRLEDLDNTNNLRYLRKHYKDPLNKNQDFKLLHFGDPDVKMSGTIGGGTIPGATAVGAQGLSGSSPSAFGGGSSFGNSGAGGSSFGNSSSSFGGSSSSFGSSGSSFGGSGSGNSGVNSSGIFASSLGNSNSNSASGSNSQNPSGSTTPDPSSGSDPTQAANGSGQSGTSTGMSSGQQPIASGPILGVASLNKDNTIREYNKKKKYNEWQFIYDPTADRGGLITTPYQPALQSFANPGQPGQNGTQAGSTTNSPFGNSSGSSFGGGQSSFGQGSSGSSFGQGSSGSSFGQSGPGNNSGGGTSSQPPSTSNSQQ